MKEAIRQKLLSVHRDQIKNRPFRCDPRTSRISGAEGRELERILLDSPLDFHRSFHMGDRVEYTATLGGRVFQLTYAYGQLDYVEFA